MSLLRSWDVVTLLYRFYKTIPHIIRQALHQTIVYYLNHLLRSENEHKH